MKQKMETVKGMFVSILQSPSEPPAPPPAPAKKKELRLQDHYWILLLLVYHIYV
jgi:hypothetical protein